MICTGELRFFYKDKTPSQIAYLEREVSIAKVRVLDGLSQDLGLSRGLIDRAAKTLLREALDTYTQIEIPRHIEVTRALLGRGAGE